MAKFDLIFSKPLLNAAGFLGFAPDPRGPVDLERLGGFFTNPVSLEPRVPARGMRCLEYPGGFLLHTGYANPGLRAVLRHNRARWSRSPLPVWAHLLVRGSEEARSMARRLEALEGVAGIELSLPLGINAAGVSILVQAAQGELPVIARLPLESFLELAPAAVRAGAGAVSLGAPRGSLLDADHHLVNGRLYGPAVFPQALHTVKEAAAAGLPVIGAGGIYLPWQAQAMLEAGALAVQLDAVLWRGGW